VLRDHVKSAAGPAADRCPQEDLAAFTRRDWRRQLVLATGALAVDLFRPRRLAASRYQARHADRCTPRQVILTRLAGQAS
jgi:DNA-binding transcriptional MocR family regulator